MPNICFQPPMRFEGNIVGLIAVGFCLALDQPKARRRAGPHVATMFGWRSPSLDELEDILKYHISGRVGDDAEADQAEGQPYPQGHRLPRLLHEIPQAGETIQAQGVARGKGPRRRTVTPQGADSAPGQDAKLRLCEAFRRATRRLRLPLRGGLQMIAQVRAALFHLVAQLAAAEGGERGIAELPPGGVEPLLQSTDILVQEFGLGHACAT